MTQSPWSRAFSALGEPDGVNSCAVFMLGLGTLFLWLGLLLGFGVAGLLLGLGLLCLFFGWLWI